MLIFVNCGQKYEILTVTSQLVVSNTAMVVVILYFNLQFTSMSISCIHFHSFSSYGIYTNSQMTSSQLAYSSVGYIAAPLSLDYFSRFLLSPASVYIINCDGLI